MADDWRNGVSVDERTKLLIEICGELKRMSGETNKRVWHSAAKYELMLWNTSTNSELYRTKLHRKLKSLMKKPSHTVGTETKGTQTGSGLPLQQPLHQQTDMIKYVPPSDDPRPLPNTQWLERFDTQCQVQMQELTRILQQQTMQLRMVQLQEHLALAQQHLQQKTISFELYQQQKQQLDHTHHVALARLEKIHIAKQAQLQCDSKSIYQRNERNGECDQHQEC